MKWFKLYPEIANHPRLRILSFEDRWHYISLMCAKADGTLDQPNEKLRDQMLSVHLGLTPVEMAQVKERLMDVELIAEDWDIINWDDKQSSDATGAARKRRQRAREKLAKEEELRNKNKEQSVTVTGQSRDIEKEETVERIWKLFPKKVAKAKCVKKLERLDMATLVLIEKDLRARVWPTETRYILNPETYINQERWLDEISTPEQKEEDLYV
ncbi:MAG: hypothetical protein VW879_17485 [Opitutae bacterium]